MNFKKVCLNMTAGICRKVKINFSYEGDKRFRMSEMCYGKSARYSTLQVSVSVDKKILMLFNINDPGNPIELAFERRYGNIVSYRWYCICSHTQQALVITLELFAVKRVLSPSLLHCVGMVMGIYSLVSPMDTLWSSPHTSGR